MKNISIIIIDRKEVVKNIFNYTFFCNFNIRTFINSNLINDSKLLNSDFTCITVYEASDLVNVIPFYNRNSSLIIFYSDSSLVFDNLEYVYTININEGVEFVRKELESIVNHIYEEKSLELI